MKHPREEEQVLPAEHLSGEQRAAKKQRVHKEEGEVHNGVNGSHASTTTYAGLHRDEVIKGRQEHISKGQYCFYKDPLMLVSAKNQYCWDEKGNRYLDAYSNVAHVGHCNDHVVDSAAHQMRQINSNTRYLHPKIVEYAKKLTATLPGNLKVCYFVNSGSEANDLAMRMARLYTKNLEIIALDNAYHGTTALCTGISPSLSTGSSEPCPDFKYYSNNIAFAPVPDTYRGKYRSDDPQAYQKYADEVKEVIKGVEGQKVAAFISESIQGVGGQIVYPDGYLKATYKIVRDAGGVCIADEVQVGFGRTGSHFWAFETQGVIPDIVSMGKPIGNGHPLACVVTTPEISKAFDASQYFNTFGGNPVSCAIGLAVLEVIEQKNLKENAVKVGKKLLPALHNLKQKHSIIGDVRGLGLFIGIELVRDHKTLEPAREEAAAIWEISKQLGVLVGLGGQHKNVLRIKPPICLTEEDADFLVDVLDKSFAKLAKQSIQ